MLLTLIAVLLPCCGLGFLVTDDFRDSSMYNADLYQGDIAGIDMTQDRNAIVEHVKLWPGASVYYELDPAVEYMRNDIMEAIGDYHNNTCVKFLPKTTITVDYIRIVNEPGCWSYVGRHSGMQKVSLGEGCEGKPTGIHELMHVIGFWHEQSRSDRDEYLEIIWENIFKGAEYNFEKLNLWENNLLGVEFDYDSIMLYGETAFSKDHKSITVKSKKEGVKLIPVYTKSGFSKTDILKINRLYECFGEVRPPRPEPPGFECNFEVDNCGFFNDYIEVRWIRNDKERAGNKGFYLEVTAELADRQSARLISPTAQNYGQVRACLKFKYYLEGSGAQSMVITQQGKRNTRIWSTEVVESKWKNVVLDIDLEGPTRFFIEAFTDIYHGSGVVALDDFSFNIRPC